MENDELVYLVIDTWMEYDKKIRKFLKELDAGEAKVNCSITAYDQCLLYFITTTKSYLEGRGIGPEEYKKFTWRGKTSLHPEYDPSRIGTDENYQLIDFS